MNRYSRDTSIGQRQVTVAPLPFEAMYRTLQNKQQQYDEAEDLEIKAKASVSALTSPISGYQEYMDEVKTNFLDKAMALHKSTPDKGSSEFNRKLKEIIGEVEADRTLVRIQRDSELYTQFIKDKSDLLKQGKYSNWRNAQYEGFTGKGANGEIIPFTYTGVQSKKDVAKLINQGLDNTQHEKTINSFYGKKNPNVKYEVTKEGKDPDKAFANVFSQLGEDGVRDWAEENGIPYKDAVKYLKSFIAPSVGFIQGVKTDLDFSADKEMRERQKHADEFATPEVTRLSNVQSPYFDENFNSKFDNEGNLIPSGFWGFQDKSNTFESDARVAKIMKNANMFYGKPDGKGNLSGGGKIGLAALKKGTNTIKDLDLIPFNDSEKGLTHRKNKLADIMSSYADVTFYDESGNKVDSEGKEKLVAELNDKNKYASVAGRFKSNNPFAPEAYQLAINGKKYIAGLESSNITDNILHAISKSNITKEPVELEKYGVTIYTRPDVNINQGDLKNNIIIRDKKTNKDVPLSQLGIQ
jgi:hypothetical protein